MKYDISCDAIRCDAIQNTEYRIQYINFMMLSVVSILHSQESPYISATDSVDEEFLESLDSW